MFRTISKQWTIKSCIKKTKTCICFLHWNNVIKISYLIKDSLTWPLLHNPQCSSTSSSSDWRINISVLTMFSGLGRQDMDSENWSYWFIEKKEIYLFFFQLSFNVFHSVERIWTASLMQLEITFSLQTIFCLNSSQDSSAGFHRWVLSCERGVYRDLLRGPDTCWLHKCVTPALSSSMHLEWPLAPLCTHTRTPTRKHTQDCVESPALGMFHALIEDKLCFRLNQKEEGVDYIVLDGELLQLQEEGIKKDHLTQPSWNKPGWPLTKSTLRTNHTAPLQHARHLSGIFFSTWLLVSQTSMHTARSRLKSGNIILTT